jgi:WD40 repeat protein
MKTVRPVKLKRCYATSFSEDGQLLVTLARNVVGWDTRLHSQRFRAHPLSHPSSCSIRPDGTQIVVKNTGGQIVVLDAEDGALIRMLDVKENNEGSNVLHSSCGTQVVDGSWSGILTARCSATGDISFRQEFPGEMITKIARARAGERWFTVHQPKVQGDAPPLPACVLVWAWPLTAPIDRFDAPGLSIHAIAVSPDGTRLCLQSRDVVVTLRLEDRQLLTTTSFQYGGSGFAVAWSPDGEEIAFVQKDAIAFHRADSMDLQTTVAIEYPSDVTYSPNGLKVALGSWTSGVLVDRIGPSRAATTAPDRTVGGPRAAK